MKRKESLKSPVDEKKSRKSIDVAEQRRRAQEYYETKLKPEQENKEAKEKAKRSSTPGKTPRKSSKYVHEEEDEEQQMAPTSSRKSARESLALREPPTKSTAKTPAKSRKSLSTANTVEQHVSPSNLKGRSSASSQVEFVSMSPNSPARHTRAADNARPMLAVDEPTEREDLNEEETTSIAAHHRIDSLAPMSSWLVLMTNLYIVIGGIAYFDVQLGFLIFLAVNVLANLCVINGV